MEKPEELQTCRCNTFPGKDPSAIKGLHTAILHMSFETQVSQEIPLSPASWRKQRLVDYNCDPEV